jgi:putative hydrolase of the HAD superfamily
LGYDQLKAIIFDLDDTLYPQVEFKRSGFRTVAKETGAQLCFDEKTIFEKLEKILIDYGPSYPWMFNRLIEQLSIPEAYIQKMVRDFILLKVKLVLSKDRMW